MSDSLTEIQKILKTVDRRDDFNFVRLLGSLVNNRKFASGYFNLEDGKTDDSTYVWEVLSAIGQDIGGALHSCVQNYIDEVSNVDTCRIKGLKSMISQFGYDYEIFQKIGFLPIEIQHLIDIFSINHNCLLRNGFMKDDFIRELEENGVLNPVSSQAQGTLFDVDVQSVYDDIQNQMLGRYEIV